MRKLILGFAATVLTTFAHASYLYWQVDTSQVSGTFNNYTVAGARVVAINGSTYPEASDTSSNVLESSHYSVRSDTWTSGSSAVGLNYADLGTSTSGYTYFIEILVYKQGSSEETMVGGHSEGLAYSNSGDYTFADLADLKSMMAATSAWTGGSYAVPEPTSGLLLLVGGALLALRRRRV